MIYVSKGDPGLSTKKNGLLFVAVALFLIAGVFGLIQHFSAVSLDSHLGDLEQRLVKVEPAYKAASTELDNRKSQFAARWSSDLVAKQSVVNGYFTGGQIQSLLTQARAAQKDNKDIGQFADPAEKMISEAEAFTTQVVGPPNYFDTLQGKASQASSYLSNATIKISDAKAYIDQKVADSWNVAHGVRLAVAYRKITMAQSQLSTANATLANGDAVQAYDDGAVVYTTVQSARDLADSETEAAKLAQTSILNAESALASASLYISSSWYNQYNASQSLNVALQSYSQALSQFAGDREHDPDYAWAKNSADQAIYQSSAAANLAATPTPIPPTATPRPTAVPQASSPIIIIGGGGSIFDDTEPSYGSQDWGNSSSNDSSSGGYIDTSPSNDSFGSNDGFGSFDSGSNDSFGSNDGFGSFDSGGSDYGSDSFGGDDGFYIPYTPNIAFVFSLS